ncbi:YqhG family protein [Paenibacillus sp. JSM ZJ436]|uniref:YqhG family protein n=1 Tax=Paenibacillus sp. JSM ZJ436 TaxID=3376190 RepID=UPI0037BD2810
MSLSPQQIQQHVSVYLDATQCQVLERSPQHVTVKLSPQADKMLTNRPYYWGFIERTGAPAETLSFTFVFDPHAYDAQLEAKARADQTSGSGASAALAQDPLLSRYYGSAPVPMLPVLGPGRIQREDVTFGSRRLQQIWQAAREEGQYLYLFEEPEPEARPKTRSAALEQWLGVCFKVEFSCDLKREELHYVAISLSRKQIVSQFDTQLQERSLSPRLPEYVHIRPAVLSLAQGAELLEQHLLEQLSERDYSWASQAEVRLAEELRIVDSYYEELLKEPDEEKQRLIQEQHEARRSEMQWQYEPKISLSAITCGLFHLHSPVHAPS